ncbi:MAG: nitroreductase family protein [bacterium]|nr:nitroreductase family protein [bacterium]
MNQKPAITSVPINEIIANRWSGRAYDTEQPVEKEQLMALLEAARWAPSCFGDQPYRYLVWFRDDENSRWEDAFKCIAPVNQEWVKNAPVLIAAIAYSKFKRNGNPNMWGQYDTGAASENLCLQAVSMGMMAHQMGGFSADALIEAFSIPGDFTPMAMIAVGWPAPADTLEGLLHDREIMERVRSPLSDNFFLNEWGNGIK